MISNCLKSPVFLLLIENSYYLTSIKIGNIHFDVIDAMKVVEIALSVFLLGLSRINQYYFLFKEKCIR